MAEDDDKNKQGTTANILAREIESWKGFEYALGEENWNTDGGDRLLCIGSCKFKRYRSSNR